MLAAHLVESADDRTLEKTPHALDTVGGGSDAAWAKAIAASVYDENTTVFIEKAIFKAFPHALYKEGDKIGARMAFKEAYPPLLEKYGKEILVNFARGFGSSDGTGSGDGTG